jgi:hypothetical protein
MRPNIFSVAFNYYRLGDEDMVTALWHYVLAAVPGVGQAFVDELASRTHLVSAKFIGALDHPQGNKANRPDLLIQSDKWSVLFEHKLDSPCGASQLERYLAFARTKNWKLAVMAKRPIELPVQVVGDAEFVAPIDLQQPRHFLWQDLQPLLRAAGHPLATEFAEFMEERGLGTFSWAGLGNPFHSRPAADTLRTLYGAVRPVFPEHGVRFIKKATSLVYEVRRPFPGVHLINVGPLESVAQCVPELRGPVMALWVWMPRKAVRVSVRVLPKRSGRLPSDSKVFVYDDNEDREMPAANHIFCERSYYVPLERILVDSPEQCNREIRAFVQACVDHLKIDIARL